MEFKIEGRWLALFGLILAVAAGLYVRFHSLYVWKASPERYFYRDRPCFTSYDGLYYANIAKHVARSPGKVKNPLHIPLLSFAVGNMCRTLKTYPENIDLYLTPILSVLFAIPLYIFFHRLKYPLAGISGALLGSISYIYLIRSTIVRFDTDTLNLFFMVSIFVSLSFAFDLHGVRKALFALLALLFSLLFFWWYRHPKLIIAPLAIYIFTEALRLSANVAIKKKIRWDSLAVLAAVIVVGVAGMKQLHLNPKDLLSPSKFYRSVSGKIKFMEKKPQLSGGFPNPAMSISELKELNIKATSKMVAGNVYMLLLGMAGLLLLFMKRPLQMVFSLPMLLLGLMAFTVGNRFGIFLSPLIGAGVGCLADTLRMKMESSPRGTFKAGVLVVAVLAAVVVSNSKSFSHIAWPRVPPKVVGDLLKLRELTPKSSRIWSWWNYGYAIEYYGERRVFINGGSFPTPTTYFVAASFSSPDPKRASNIIKTIASRGTGFVYWFKRKKSLSMEKAIKEAVYTGKYVRPKVLARSPVYWALTYDMIPKFHWINFYGTWNFNAKTGAKDQIIPVFCRFKKPGIANCNVGTLNLITGILVKPNLQRIPIKALVVKRDRLMVRKFREKGVYLVGRRNRNGMFMFLMGEQPFNTCFTQMFILGEYNKELFKLIYDDFPYLVLYKVL